MYHVYTCIHVYKKNYMLTKSKSNWAYKVLNVQIVISRIVENYSLKLSFYIIIKLNIFQKRFIYKSNNLSSPTRYFDCKPKIIFFWLSKKVFPGKFMFLFRWAIMYVLLHILGSKSVQPNMYLYDLFLRLNKV